jgi:hypothetical protein
VPASAVLTVFMRQIKTNVFTFAFWADALTKRHYSIGFQPDFIALVILFTFLHLLSYFHGANTRMTKGSANVCYITIDSACFGFVSKLIVPDECCQTLIM